MCHYTIVFSVEAIPNARLSKPTPLSLFILLIVLGDTIQWKRGNMLGKGAYGVVWCGLTNHGGLIAVKQIELNIEDMERTELEYEKIQQEVELLKTLQHENIVG